MKIIGREAAAAARQVAFHTQLARPVAGEVNQTPHLMKMEWVDGGGLKRMKTIKQLPSKYQALYF